MKVSELTGAELDWYVAKAEGIENIELRTAQRATNRICVVKASGGRQFDYTYSPSTQWNCGGQIIEREQIHLMCIPATDKGDPAFWDASLDSKIQFNTHDETQLKFIMATGATPLIAAMRAYVASVFGEEVEDI